MKTLQHILDDKKHKEVISIAPNRPVFDALVILAEYKIGALAVVENSKLVGIFSERDYAREVILQGRSSKTTQIFEVMTSKVITGKPDDMVDKTLNLMSEKRFRHLPVLEGARGCQANRGRGHSSRLRVSGRKRQVRTRLHRRRSDFHRSLAGIHSGHGFENGEPPADDSGRSCHRARPGKARGLI